MTPLDLFEKNDRFTLLMYQAGFALWQLQELEWTTIRYLVIRLRAQRGIGEEAGRKLLEEAGKRTFGSAINELIKAGVIDTATATALPMILGERNWLIHRARRESRGVLNSDTAYAELIQRLHKISDDALDLLKKLGALTEQYVVQNGVSSEFIEAEAGRLAKEWSLIED